MAPRMHWRMISASMTAIRFVGDTPQFLSQLQESVIKTTNCLIQSVFPAVDQPQYSKNCKIFGLSTTVYYMWLSAAACSRV